MFKIFKKLNKVEIISEPERRVDGFYFHVKVPCVVEPLTISTRDLLLITALMEPLGHRANGAT